MVDPEESEENTGESDAMLVEEEKTAEDALPGGIMKYFQIIIEHLSCTVIIQKHYAVVAIGVFNMSCRLSHPTALYEL